MFQMQEQIRNEFLYFSKVSASICLSTITKEENTHILGKIKCAPKILL